MNIIRKNKNGWSLIEYIRRLSKFYHHFNKYCNIMRGASCTKGYGKSLTLLLLGKPGIGKSTLVNGLVGQNVAEVSARGEIAIEGVTKELQCYEFIVEDVTIQVWDTPGLLDPNIGTRQTLLKIKEILDEVDLFLFCIDMTTTRVFEKGDENAMITMISDILGERFWNKAIIPLVQANTLINQLTDQQDTPEQVKAAFKNNLKHWKKLLGDKVPVRKVKVVPVGICRKPLLFPGDKSPWLSKFWRKVYKKLCDEKQLALTAITLDRLLVYSNSSMKYAGQTCRKPISVLRKLVNLKNRSFNIGDISPDEDDVISQVKKLSSDIDALDKMDVHGDFSIDENSESDFEVVGNIQKSTSFSDEDKNYDVQKKPVTASSQAEQVVEEISQLPQTLAETTNKKIGSLESVSPQSDKDFIPVEAPVSEEEKTHQSTKEDITTMIHGQNQVQLMKENMSSTLPDQNSCDLPKTEVTGTTPILELPTEPSDSDLSTAPRGETTTPSSLLLATLSVPNANTKFTDDVTTDDGDAGIVGNYLTDSECTISGRIRSSTYTDRTRSNADVAINSQPHLSCDEHASVSRFRSKSSTEGLSSISTTNDSVFYITRSDPPQKHSRESLRSLRQPQESISSVPNKKIGRFNKERFGFLEKPSGDASNKKCTPPRRRLLREFKPCHQVDPSPPQIKKIDTPGKIDRSRLDLSNYKSPFKEQTDEESYEYSAKKPEDVSVSTKPLEKSIITSESDALCSLKENVPPTHPPPSTSSRSPLPIFGLTTPGRESPMLTLGQQCHIPFGPQILYGQKITDKTIPTPSKPNLDESLVYIQSLKMSSENEPELSLEAQTKEADTHAKEVDPQVKEAVPHAKEADPLQTSANNETMVDVALNPCEHKTQPQEENTATPNMSYANAQIPEVSGTRNPEDQKIIVSQGFFGKMKKTLQRIFHTFF